MRQAILKKIKMKVACFSPDFPFSALATTFVPTSVDLEFENTLLEHLSSHPFQNIFDIRYYPGNRNFKSLYNLVPVTRPLTLCVGVSPKSILTTPSSINPFILRA